MCLALNVMNTENNIPSMKLSSIKSNKLHGPTIHKHTAHCGHYILLKYAQKHIDPLLKCEEIYKV